MGLSFFKKLFGNEDGATMAAGQSDVNAAAEPSLKNEDCSDSRSGEGRYSGKAADGSVTIESLEDFVLYVVKALVDQPEEVTIGAIEKNQLNVIQVRCAKKDIGKIVGKSGKTIAAIRALVNGAAGRGGLRATVDVLD